MRRVVVLLGPPASGKSTIGRELAGAGLRWREWEEEILERWGSRAAFVAAKQTALPELHREIRSWIDADGQLAVIETTGLSDAALLDALERDQLSFTVRLDVSEAEAQRRVRTRPQGRHLTDDPQASLNIARAFEANVRPCRHVDLAIDTEQTGPTAASRLIIGALES